jgi:hypothetical protein
MPTKVYVPTLNDEVNKGLGVIDDLASTIANPPTDQPLLGALGSAGQKYCDYLGAAPGVVGGYAGSGIFIAALMCKPYWDSKGYDAPVLAPPFSGGQCNTTYAVNGYITQPNGTENFASQDYAGGGVAAYSVAQTGPFRKTLTLKGKNGVTSTRNLDYANGGSARFSTPFRLDGQPDNCGDPPAVIEPGPNPPPTPTFPPGEEPGVDPTGQPYFTVPDIPSPIPGGDPIPFPDPLPGEPGGGPAPPANPYGSGPGSPGASGDTGIGGDEEGEAPPGQVLVSLKVDILTVPDGARPYGPDQYRAVCYIFMGTEEGLDMDFAGAVLMSGQMVYAETEFLTHWRVEANPGWNLRVTPYYREKDE